MVHTFSCELNPLDILTPFASEQSEASAGRQSATHANGLDVWAHVAGFCALLTSLDTPIAHTTGLRWVAGTPSSDEAQRILTVPSYRLLSLLLPFWRGWTWIGCRECCGARSLTCREGLEPHVPEASDGTVTRA